MTGSSCHTFVTRFRRVHPLDLSFVLGTKKFYKATLEKVRASAVTQY